MAGFILLSFKRKQYFPDQRGGVHGFGTAPINVQNVQQNQQGPPATGNRMFGGNNWGRGNVLGRE